MTTHQIWSDTLNLGDADPATPKTSGLAWLWHFNLRSNPGNARLYFDVKDVDTEGVNAVEINRTVVGHLPKHSSSDFATRHIDIDAGILKEGHNDIYIESGWLDPNSDSYATDNFSVRNIYIEE